MERQTQHHRTLQMRQLSTAVPSADELLQQVAMEQTTKTASRPALPVGLIAVTFVVLALLLVVAWFALSSADLSLLARYSMAGEPLHVEFGLR
jgi:hypothetical protein